MSDFAIEPVDIRRQAFYRIVAGHVAQALADRGLRDTDPERLVADPDLRTQDLALLGLDSLDWIGLATRLETAFGVDLPDHVLVRSEYRCIESWTEALLVADAGSPQPGHVTESEVSRAGNPTR